jgi:hypothetical protein
VKLKPIAWSAVPRAVLMPLWAAQVQRFREALAGIRAADLADVAKDWSRSAAFEKALGRRPDPIEGRSIAVLVLGCALARALVRCGWTPEAKPGQEVGLVLGGERIEPFAVTAGLIRAGLAAEAWRVRCREVGIEELPLDAPPAGD